ncbi:MAG: FCD domain-containing protein [Actinomycetota bacterium]|nr:FCD domain-containing protein [Actinomycetota bacterium]
MDDPQRPHAYAELCRQVLQPQLIGAGPVPDDQRVAEREGVAGLEACPDAVPADVHRCEPSGRDQRCADRVSTRRSAWRMWLNSTRRRPSEPVNASPRFIAQTMSRASARWPSTCTRAPRDCSSCAKPSHWATSRCHRALVGLSGSGRLLAVADALSAEVRLALARVDRLRRNAREQVASHRELLTLLERGDLDATVAELERHLAGAERSLVDAIHQPPQQAGR